MGRGEEIRMTGGQGDREDGWMERERELYKEESNLVNIYICIKPLWQTQKNEHN